MYKAAKNLHRLVFVILLAMSHHAYGGQAQNPLKAFAADPALCTRDPAQLATQLDLVQNAYSHILQKQLHALESFKSDLSTPDKPKLSDSLIDAAVTFSITAVLSGVLGPVSGMAGKKVTEFLKRSDASLLGKIRDGSGHYLAEAVAEGIQEAAKNKLIETISEARVKARVKGLPPEKMFIEMTRLVLIDTQKIITDQFIRNKRKFESDPCGLVNASALLSAVDEEYMNSVDLQYVSAVRAWSRLIHGSSACTHGNKPFPAYDAMGSGLTDPALDKIDKGLLVIDATMKSTQQNPVINFAAMPGINEEIRKRLLNNYGHVAIENLAFRIRIILHTSNKTYVMDEAVKDKIVTDDLTRHNENILPCLLLGPPSITTNDLELYSYKRGGIHFDFPDHYSDKDKYRDLTVSAHVMILDIRYMKISDLKDIKGDATIDLD